MQPPGLVVTVIPGVGSDGFYSGMTAGNYSFFANAGARTFYIVQDGNVIWQKYATYPTMIAGTNSGIVYVGWMEHGSAPGTLEAYNFLTGELLWSYDAGFASYFLKSDAAGNLLFSQMDFVGGSYYGPSRLVKLDPNTGNVIWSVYPYGNTPEKPGPTFSSVSPVAIGADGYYYAPCDMGDLFKYDSNGIELWRAPIPLDTKSIYESNGSIVAVSIIAPGYESVITKIDSATGQFQSDLIFNTTTLGFGAEARAIWGMDIILQGDAIYVSGILYTDPTISPSSGNSEVFVAKFSLTLQPIWTYTLGGDGDDGIGSRGTSLSINADGSFTVFSSTTSTSVSGVPLQGAANFVMYTFRDDPGALVGTAQADTVLGTAGADLINTGAGNDVVIAGAGADLIIGGSGAGNDSYNGGLGIDTVRYTSATAGIIVNLSAASNQAMSVGGADAAGIGVDQLISIENVIAGNFDDFLTGNSANNDIDGQGGIDTVYLSGSRVSYSVVQNVDGSFTITDNRSGSPDGVDTYRSIERFTFTDGTVDAAGLLSQAPTGTNGDDVFLATAAIETFNGLSGSDTVSFINATVGVTANLANPAVNTGFAQGDTYISIENLTGSRSNDFLTGDAGANILTGGEGTDALEGLAGNDTYVVNLTASGSLEDTITEVTNAGTDTLILEGATGQAASITLATNLENLDGSRTGTRALNLTGNTAANVIRGNAAANIITGAAAADNMDGGDGSDLYVIAAVADYATGEVISDTGIINSAADELRYTGTAAASLVLNAQMSGVERVVIGTGTGQPAVTTGTGAINVNVAAVLYGLTVIGNNGANNIVGTAFADTITANGGNDTVNGGAGADTMDGGAGNDTYVVDNVGDKIVEAAAGGTDLVQVAIAAAGGTYTLGAEIENATLTNAVAFNLTGNTVANTLTGNAANNVLDGGAGTLIGLAGNDTYIVDLTAAGALQDTVTEAANAGTDTIVLRGASTNTAVATLTIGANIENLDASGSGNSFLNFTGNGLANTITGNSRANVITGGALGDTMNGLDGGDIYLVASTGDYTGDVINDTGAGGVDEFRFAATAAATLTLTASTNGLERAVIGTGTGVTAVITATTAINLNASAVGNGLIIGGNNGNNALTGTNFNDIIEGNTGNDRLFGGLGNDTLTGGAGSDSFIFNTAPNASTNLDQITDFNVVADTIELENAVFTALGTATGPLSAAAFVIGAGAADATDRIVYNSVTGALIYDSNGNLAGGSVQIATLATGLALTNADFVII